MITELNLIAGTPEEIFNYILDLKEFDMWMPGKDFPDQIQLIQGHERACGPIMFYGRSEGGRTVNAQWVVITKPNRFLK